MYSVSQDNFNLLDVLEKIEIAWCCLGRPDLDDLPEIRKVRETIAFLRKTNNENPPNESGS